MDDAEHRRAMRVSITNEVVLEYEGHGMRAPAMDLSPRGISVWAPGSATTAPIRITMAIEDRAVILRGRVARQFESDGGAVWGIEFEADSDEESLRIVAEFVERETD